MIVDLFSGPGGWCEGLRALGRDDVVGLEWDRWACATRAAAGHRTIRCDVEHYPTAPVAGRVEGLIASPPCPDWSSAGKGAGRAGKSGYLVDVVPRWVEALRPEWVACEQVPPALAVWREHAEVYRSLGYDVRVGILNAADYGVPQTRRRAILMAHRGRTILPPWPTHAKDPGAPRLFGDRAPWVTMAAALGIAGIRPGCSKGHGRGQRDPMPGDVPAPTLCFGKDAASWRVLAGGQWEFGDVVPMTVADALALQSFAPGYPLQGSKTQQFKQVGNAVPPLLAAAVIGALL